MALTINSIRFQGAFNFDIKDTQAFGDVTMSAVNQAGSEGTLSQGTAAGQANKLVIWQGTIAASGNKTLDLSGTEQDPFKNTMVFTKLIGIFIRQIASSGNTATSIDVGAAASNSIVSWAVKVFRGGLFEWFDPTGTGLVVSNGAADNFRILNNDSGQTAEVFAAFVGQG